MSIKFGNKVITGLHTWRQDLWDAGWLVHRSRIWRFRWLVWEPPPEVPPHVKFTKAGRAYVDIERIIDTELARIPSDPPKVTINSNGSRYIKPIDIVRSGAGFAEILRQRGAVQ